MRLKQMTAGTAELEICENQFAKALAVMSGEHGILFLSLDLSGFPHAYSEGAVTAICARCGLSPENVMVACSGTRNGPVTSPRYGAVEVDEAFLEVLVKKLPELAHDAVNALADASVGTYRASLPHIAHESRFATRNYKVVNEWMGLPRNEVLSPEGPSDPDLDVLVARDPAGEPMTLAWSYGAADHFGQSLSQSVQEEMDNRLGRHVPCMYMPGCGANVRFTYDLEKTTGLLADSIMAAQAMACCDPSAIIGSVRKNVILPVRDYSSFHDRAEVALKFPDALSAFEKEIEAMQEDKRVAFSTAIQAVRIGSYAIAGFPGDCFARVGIDLKKRSPFKTTCAIGYCNDSLGFVLPRESFAYGGFEAWPARWAKLGKGSGEFMVDELSGMLKGIHGK
jgi:neutral ceramidase